ncbi:MAG: molybdopterin-binding protein [Acidobacteria bacterium]|nr:molybdopterin-binding protein [Acidobacteriota bacterium]
MRAQTVDVKASTGRILCCTIFRPGGKKLLAKGHILNDEDVRILEIEGMQEVWVTQLEDGEVGEDEAVLEISTRIGCGALELRPAAGGRANLFATEDCCLLVDDELLKQINCTASIVIATGANFSFVQAGQRVATIKSTPFAVSAHEVEAVRNILTERGPILQARPLQDPQIAVLYTDPVQGDRARQLFDNIMRQRLESMGVQQNYVLSSLEEENAICRALQHLLRAKPAVIVIASTTAPQGPEDVVGRAMLRLGTHIERFLAPVEPGSLMLLGYKDDIPIVSAPGCYRSAKKNVLDIVLPPLLARYRMSGWEIASMGHGGLLG